MITEIPDVRPGSYYVSALADERCKPVAIAGPFPAHVYALAAVESVRGMFRSDPRAAFMAWGTLRRTGGATDWARAQRPERRAMIAANINQIINARAGRVDWNALTDRERATAARLRGMEARNPQPRMNNAAHRISMEEIQGLANSLDRKGD